MRQGAWGRGGPRSEPPPATDAPAWIGGALPEAAAGHAELVAPDDTAGWVRALTAQRGHDNTRSVNAVSSGYRPPSWIDSAGTITDTLTGTFR